MTATSDSFWVTRNPVGRTRDFLTSQRLSAAPHPPGPRGLPFIGVLPKYQADPFEYLRQAANIYGDVYRLPWPLCDLVVLNHPDYASRVLNCHESEYGRVVGRGINLAGLASGAPIGMLNGERYRERRTLLGPMFGRTQLVTIAACTTDEFDKRLARWDRFADAGEPIDLQAELSSVMMPAFMRAMFSVQLTDSEVRQIDSDVRTWLSAFTYTFVFLGHPRLLRDVWKVSQAWLRVRRWVKRQIDERLAGGQSHDDMLQVIVDAHREHPKAITRRDLVMEIMLLMGAGWETGTAATAWTLGLLAQNPQAQRRLYEEVDGLQGALPTFDDLDRLRWTKACFHEGLRLRGLPILLRFARIDDNIGGYRIRRGNLIAVSPYAMHRDLRWWGPDPDGYDPKRFYDKDIVATRPNLAFIPFGAGPHRCIAASMGDMSAQLLLAQLHQRFRIQTPPGWVAQHDPGTPWPDVPAVISKVSAVTN